MDFRKKLKTECSVGLQLGKEQIKSRETDTGEEVLGGCHNTFFMAVFGLHSSGKANGQFRNELC